MRKVNLKEIPEQERKSPKGKFRRCIEEYLGRARARAGIARSVEAASVRPGVGANPEREKLCPYHAHAAESELYLVVSGRGSIRDKEGITEVGPGDAFFFQPGEAHQVANAGSEDFVYYVIADNPRSGGATGDSCYYPDSGKWAVVKEGSEEVMVKGTETDYFDGEE